MKKNRTLVMSGVMTVLLACLHLDVSGQSSGTRYPGLLRKAPTCGVNPQNADAAKKRNALLSFPLSLNPEVTDFKRAATVKDIRKKKETKKAVSRIASGDGRELWGNVVYQNNWTQDDRPYGMYSFNAATPMTMSALGLHDYMRSNGGGTLVDNEFHSMYLDTSMSMWGIILLYHTAFDATTWEVTSATTSLDDYSLAAFETAVDQSTSTVYGVFYTSDMSGIEFGIINYNTMTRTTIGPANQRYAALGVSRERVLYGIAADGNLYKIDTNTGAETKVGPTGVTISNENDQYYAQSGEIDQTTNTFYWASIDSEGRSALYTVDLNTGTATKIGDFSNNEQIYGLSIPQAPPAEGAPAAATELEAAFEGASLTGKLKFKAPSTTFSGAELNGELTYEVLNERGQLTTGNAMPGDEVETEITTTEGLNSFIVKFYNDQGEGAKARCTQYVGNDTPKAVDGLTFLIDNSTGIATVEWTAPTAGVNNGYIGGLTYEVVRYPDNVVVASDLTSTSFTETLTIDGIQSVCYGVSAVNAGKKSTETLSNRNFVGNGITPPYSESFDDASALDLFTIIDNNQDGMTWRYSDYNQSVRYQFSYTSSADDWLITPKLKVEAGKIYNLSFKSSSYDRTALEKLEVKYGRSNTAEGMDNTLLPVTVIPASSEEYKIEIKPQETGNIYIGFHAVSDVNMGYLFIDDIQVSVGVTATAPDSVTNIIIVPDNTGAAKANVSFTAPTKDISGNILKTISKIEVTRNGKQAKTFDNPSPGEQLSFDDTAETDGQTSYVFTAINEDGEGRTAEATAYIGIDTPSTVDGIKLVDQGTAVNMNWDKVATTGANGGVVIPENVDYNIYDLVYDSYGYIDTVRIATTKALEYKVEINTTEGEQDLLQYGVTAENKAGKGNVGLSPTMVKGTPYSMPFVESFAGGATERLWYTTKTGFSNFGISRNISVDNDGGSMVLMPIGDNESSTIHSGNISLEGSKSPGIVFCHYATPGQDMRLSVELQKPDGGSDTAMDIDYQILTGNAGWKTEILMLPAEYLSLPYFTFSFKLDIGEATAQYYIDNIRVRDVYDYDLTAGLSAPDVITKGTNTTLTVIVGNNGSKPVANYTVNIYDGDEKIESRNVDEALEPFVNRDFTFDYKPSVFHKESYAEIKAEVVYGDDKNKDDNISTVSIELKESELATPKGVTAKTENGNVRLDWNAPSSIPEQKTEDFESYTPWATDAMGLWTTIDGDKGTTGGLFSNISYPNQGVPFAFIIFKPEDLSVQINDLAPYSGRQYAAAVYSGSSQSLLDADNWLISPALSGDAQTVTFWVANTNGTESYPETFDVLYSTTGTSREDFTKIGDTHTASSGEWELVSIDIPQGATHFAIHHNTEGDKAFFFKIDNISYIAGTTTPKGYNIYRNSEKIGETIGETTTYTDTNVPSGSYVYSVTAVYESGESAPTDAAIETSVDGITDDKAPSFTVYTIDGCLAGKDMTTLKSLKKGVYIVNNEKVIVE